MSTYLHPGVYIEEFSPGAPIEGVGTSTAAFIGVAHVLGAYDPLVVGVGVGQHGEDLLGRGIHEAFVGRGHLALLSQPGGQGFVTLG